MAESSSDISGWDPAGSGCLEDFSLGRAWWTTLSILSSLECGALSETVHHCPAECDVNFNILIRHQTLMGEFSCPLSIVLLFLHKCQYLFITVSFLSQILGNIFYISLSREVLIFNIILREKL